MPKNICFNSTYFFTSTLFTFIIIIALFISLLYYKLYNNSNVDNKEIYDLIKNKFDQVKNTNSDVINKIFNRPISIIKRKEPEMLPEREYVGPRDYSLTSQQIGFIYNNNGQRYPLYENRKDNRYYYHVIDDTRNNIRIKVDTPKNEQVYDKQVITIPEIGNDFNIKLYEYSGNIYNPNSY